MTRTLRSVALTIVAAVLGVTIIATGTLAWLSATGRASGTVLAVLLLSVLLLFCGAFLLVGAHMADQVRNPLAEVHAALTSIAGGHFHERVIPSGTTESRRLGLTVNDLAAKLAARDRQLEHTVASGTISALLSGVAHEINNPLSYVTINESLIASGARKLSGRDDVPLEVRHWGEKVAKWTDRNLAGMERLAIITRALREVVRQEGSERDVNLLVRAAVGITHHRFPPDVDTTLNLDAKQLASVDGTVLFHALHALLLDVASRSQSARALLLTTHDEGMSIRITIHYDGPPPPQEILASLQEMEAADFAAALPLHHVKRALTAAGGVLTCLPLAREGTTWTIELPVSVEAIGFAQDAPAEAPLARPMTG